MDPIYLTTDIESFRNLIKSGRAREYTGGEKSYDARSAQQFIYLLEYGLKQDDKVLDIGCGNLALGRLLMPYLSPNRYFGIEPEKWLLNQGFAKEIGWDIILIKKPKFSTNRDFNLEVFKETFDYIMAYSIFSHASPKMISKCFSGVKKCMKDSGAFFFSYVPSFVNLIVERRNEDVFFDGWVYPGVNAYTDTTIKRLANENELVVYEFDRLSVNQQKWAVATHK